MATSDQKPMVGAQLPSCYRVSGAQALRSAATSSRATQTEPSVPMRLPRVASKPLIYSLPAAKEKLPAVLEPAIIRLVASHALDELEDAFERQHFRLLTLSVVCKAFRDALMGFYDGKIVLRPASKAQLLLPVLATHPDRQLRVVEAEVRLFDWAQLRAGRDLDDLARELSVQAFALTRLLNRLPNLRILHLHIPPGPFPALVQMQDLEHPRWRQLPTLPVDPFLKALSRSAAMHSLHSLRLCACPHDDDVPLLRHPPARVFDASFPERFWEQVSLAEQTEEEKQIELQGMHTTWPLPHLAALVRACSNIRSLHTCGSRTSDWVLPAGSEIYCKHLTHIDAGTRIYSYLVMAKPFTLRLPCWLQAGGIDNEAETHHGRLLELEIAYIFVDSARLLHPKRFAHLRFLQSQACNAANPDLLTFLSPLIKLKHLDLGRITDGLRSEDAGAIALRALNNINSLLRLPGSLPRLERLTFDSSPLFNTSAHIAVLHRIVAITWLRDISFALTDTDSTPSVLDTSQFHVECYWHLLAEQQRDEWEDEADELDRLLLDVSDEDD